MVFKVTDYYCENLYFFQFCNPKKSFLKTLILGKAYARDK